MIQYLSKYLKPVLSTAGSIISTPVHQPVPGGGPRRDHNAGKVRHDRSARRAHARPLLASASPCAPRDAHRHIRAECPDSTHATIGTMLKIHAAARNMATLRLVRHRHVPLTCAQARARTIVSANGRRAGFHFDHSLAGSQPICSEAAHACLRKCHNDAREERVRAAQQSETQANLLRSQQTKMPGRFCTASCCARDLHLAARMRVHARRHGP